MKPSNKQRSTARINASRKAGRQYPELLPTDITPEGAVITKAAAKKFFRSWILKIGFARDRDDAAYHVEIFSDEMEQFLETLTSNLDELSDLLLYSNNDVDLIKQMDADLNKLREDWRKAVDPYERQHLEEQLAGMDRDHAALLQSADDLRVEYIRGKEALADFKKDKRRFLVSYTNRITVGKGKNLDF